MTETSQPSPPLRGAVPPLYPYTRCYFYKRLPFHSAPRVWISPGTYQTPRPVISLAFAPESKLYIASASHHATLAYGLGVSLYLFLLQLSHIISLCLVQREISFRHSILVCLILTSH